MSAMRPPSPDLIPNPFIKKRNLAWVLGSPPPTSIRTSERQEPNEPSSPSPAQHPDQFFGAQQHPSPSDVPAPSAAAIESGQASTADHLAFFTTALAKHAESSNTAIPRLLPISSYASLYRDSAGSPRGAHFVVHQHDHPIAGTHYDLRLQINGDSSVSWAIMYGLPGDPNSARLNRNATETRVHCLWNHLIETASKSTGSLLIWDTGTYSILPRRSKHAPAEDPSSPLGSPSSPSPSTQQDLLRAAFQNRKIRLRLHGARLPDPYVLSLRLTKSEDAAGRAKSSKPGPRRRRQHRPHQYRPSTARNRSPQLTSSSEDERQEPRAAAEEDEEHLVPKVEDIEGVSAMEREIRELEDEEVRRTNAYPGAFNSIGSIHQRKWYLSLDRTASGFIEKRAHGTSTWVQDPDNTNLGDARLSFPFHVLGAEHERSILTGRTGADILKDEGVNDFIPRKGWRPVVN